ncbi:hypothetical protein AB670_00710 [Chryseobacterium sp. MOF25P]|uniref:hypothetical protein n=1 Tax=unclassified Chryseobacterium TaxID=2593645 RepID=UPI000805FF09|nr:MULTISPECIES: hypothetical protein [unclassified Chryseobacterium]OBW42927.1 hypothetical protein AB670_00710 [Chryseobacterium sp. MOF25P]OBW47203.1 hypothetical protein AB671_00688 [Chryseobacterium sp. BGARF1]
MKFYLTIISLLLYSLGNAQLTKENKEKLLKDLVTVTPQKFIFKEINLFSNKTDKSVQILITADSDKDFISRDNFLSTVDSIVFMIISGMYTTEELAKYDIKEIDDLIGSPDVTIKIVMTKDGVQILVTTKNGTNKETLSWDELL